MIPVRCELDKRLSSFARADDWPDKLPCRPIIGDFIYTAQKHRYGWPRAKVSEVSITESEVIITLSPECDDLEEAKEKYLSFFGD